MFSSQILIPSKPFFSPLNPSPKTLARIPLRLSTLKPLANKKGKDLVNGNSNQDALDAKGEISKDGNIPNSERQPPPNPNPKPNSDEPIPFIKPRKKRRGRPSEAQYAEDYIRKQLEQTLSSIRSEDPDLFEEKAKILQDRIKDPNFDNDTIRDSNFNEDAESSTDSSDEDVEKENENEKEKDEDPDWPVDAEVGWGIRASEYFEKHPIKNVVENGVEIDWEGEIDKGWVQEINCLEWESFAFHPSPLVVLVFERYKRPADNWKFLQELEKAAKVFWSSKNHLPPRTVKIDVNIERDLASALRIEEEENCPQLLFLKGNYILYREKEIRSSDEIVKMIAHFYYNAKKPEWITSAEVTSS